MLMSSMLNFIVPICSPSSGLSAMESSMALRALSQSFYREELWRQCGAASLEDFLVASWEGNFLRRDANNLLAMIHTWQRADIARLARQRLL